MNNSVHSAHCRACKERVREILAAIYGECRTHQQFPWPALPQPYATTNIGNSLQAIHDALSQWRGHCEFIKSPQVPPCDFYVSTPPFILEFDESQHFSAARLITLELYPKAMPTGFAVAHWRDLCRRIDAVDEQPADRDERRAWYDVLRDLVPIVYGLQPTIRLYAGDYEWCRLDAANREHLDIFKGFLIRGKQGG